MRTPMTVPKMATASMMATPWAGCSRLKSLYAA
jgi:hypothetical protein